MSDVPREPTTDDPAAPESAPTAPPGVVDLDGIARDLEGVDAALHRLDDGTYWSDEITGEEIPDEVLAANPTARRAEPT